MSRFTRDYSSPFCIFLCRVESVRKYYRLVYWNLPTMLTRLSVGIDNISRLGESFEYFFIFDAIRFYFIARTLFLFAM